MVTEVALLFRVQHPTKVCDKLNMVKFLGCEFRSERQGRLCAGRSTTRSARTHRRCLPMPQQHRERLLTLRVGCRRQACEATSLQATRELLAPFVARPEHGHIASTPW